MGLAVVSTRMRRAVLSANAPRACPAGRVLRSVAHVNAAWSAPNARARSGAGLPLVAKPMLRPVASLVCLCRSPAVAVAVLKRPPRPARARAWLPAARGPCAPAACVAAGGAGVGAWWRGGASGGAPFAASPPPAPPPPAPPAAPRSPRRGAPIPPWRFGNRRRLAFETKPPGQGMVGTNRPQGAWREKSQQEAIPGPLLSTSNQ